MDTFMAKEYMYIPVMGKEIYISKQLDTIRGVDKMADKLIGVYAVIDTSSGDKLFGMDFDYSGDPIICSGYLHKKFILTHYQSKTIIQI